MATALAACGGKSEPLGPTATVPIGTTTTNPYAVPQVIDEAYVNRVLAGLDHAAGEMLRLVVSTKTIPPEALERLRALYIGSPRQNQLSLFSADAADGFANYRPSPSDHETVISRLIVASPDCIFAEVLRDYSGASLTASEPTTLWVVLVPSDKYVVRSVYNSTNWVYIYDGLERDGTAPEDPCADL